MLHWSLDLAKNPGMEIDQINRFLDDMHHAPGWRVRADIECDYYDSNQYDPSIVAELEARGLPVIVVNLIKPTIDVVLGMEAKTRSDWKVLPESENGRVNQNLAKALSELLHKAERMTRADMSIADAFAEQVKSGIGWVEVGKNGDPFGYRYRVRSPHRREMYWDTRSRENDLSDARYVCRRKWHDVDHVAALFPQHRDILLHAGDFMAHWDPAQFTHSYPYLQDNLIERDWGLDEAEWRDSERRRVMLYEVWYRKWMRGHVLTLKDGRVMEFDKKNIMHQIAVDQNFGKVESASYNKMRLSWWMGPVRFDDIPTPHPHNEFPYVPFWGYREDRTRMPYGLIRSMMPLQDEINARRNKMLWQLSSRQVLTEQGVVKDHTSVQKEIARPDAYIVLEDDPKGRSIDERFKINEHKGLSAQQFDVYKDSKETLQDTAGVFHQMLGKGQNDSGVAINSLVEQGTTTLAKIFDNHRDARRRVGKLLTSLIQNDMGSQLTEVEITGQSGNKTIVILNDTKYTGNGLEYRDNDVMRANLNVELADAPSNPTYRAQQFKELSEMVKSLDPQFQGMIMDIVIGASDLPDKDIIAQRFRDATGLTMPENMEAMSPEEKEQLEQKLQQREEENQRMLEMEAAEKRKLDAEAEEKEASAEEKRTKADLNEAQTEETRVGTRLAIAGQAEPEPTERDSVKLNGGAAR